jgi:peptide/nickel transport system substrate-binding protein
MKHFRYSLFFMAFWSVAGGPPAPRWGGELRFCVRADPKTLDPLETADQPGLTVRYLTGGVLLRLNRATQALEPELAESWHIESGGRAIEFRIRKSVKFSDGSAFTAADVAYTLKRLFDPASRFPIADSFRRGPGAIVVEQRGPDQIRIVFPQAAAGVERLFDEVVIVSRLWPAARRGAIGMPVLGPYTVVEYRTGAYIRLARNPNYWRTDATGRRLPYIDTLRLLVQQNRSLELLRFTKGEIDMVDTLDPDDYVRLARGGPWRVDDLGPGLGAEQLWFNQAAGAPIPDYKKNWFRSREFRTGLSAALNRADISRVAFGGRAVPAPGAISPANRFWFDSRVPAPIYAPQQALATLAQAGFRSAGGTLRDSRGNAVELSIITNSGNRLRERTAALIQEDLAKIGIRVTVVALDFPSLIERITRTFDYDACLLGFFSVDLDPSGQMNLWLSSANAHAWNPEQKTPATGWEAEIDRLMERQATESIPAKRKAAFDQVQEIAARESPMLFLVYRNTLCAVSSELQNVLPSVVGPSLIWNIERLYFAPARHIEAKR